ncbi:unnamed protein product [Lactuca virosa]|uniref:Small ribosomal subunit protein uS2c n=1 Tax=Lactuca virosa TaxID=75947 RepID=A0AAU9LNR3_9ASTR|nr:unnamed protein product [Lactuca virosa]
MPLGTAIHNIEITLGKGGQLARAAGGVAKLIAKEGKSATLKLPSGEVRLISKNCSATVGQVGNVGVNQKRKVWGEAVWGEMTRRYWNINLEEMMEAGVHFGHGTRKWNPKMAPYISAKRKASRGKQFLIVGTKNKEADSVAWAAIKARCHYVNKKWLGGMLTNWSTTETRLHKFRDLRTEQKTGGGSRT